MMAAFVSLHQSKKLILINAEMIQVVAPVPAYRMAGAEVRFTDGTGIDVDESVEDIEALL